MDKKLRTANGFSLILIAVLFFGFGVKNVLAQETDVLYVPLIGITSVPEPLSLPSGSGEVTYQYAVKNFLQEVALTNIEVVDDSCSLVKFIEGDDNNDSKLDFSETWRYACTTNISKTTESIATAKGTINDLTATHKAYATVVVGLNDPPPLVSIVNITKVAYPLSLPPEGGKITFTYRVNNPGVVPLENVTVSDDKCLAMSSKLGDTNGNNRLDVNEVWIYTCTMVLTQTTINTATVSAYANGLKAIDDFTLAVKVNTPITSAIAKIPSLPNTGGNPNVKLIVWGILGGILAILLLVLFVRNSKSKKSQQNLKSVLATLFLFGLLLGLVGVGYYFLVSFRLDRAKPVNTLLSDKLFGWKFPVAKFPLAGSEDQLAYSSIRDPGGVPQGLPVRLKIPAIRVDSAIEDAVISPDGRMDVPEGSVNVAWFSLGPHPGKEGSAVIGGHFGITNEVPFVFYNLDKLKIGDKVYVIDDNDHTHAFQVRSIKSFDRNADATTVFTSDDGLAHVNLITCEGIWNQVNGSYPERLVIFTDAIPTEAIPVPRAALPKQTIVRTYLAVAPAPLRIGSRGEAVVILQTALVQKGFLLLPIRTVKGYYGALTRAAVTKYQRSVGLTPSGVFDQNTRMTFFPAPLVAKPALPTTSLAMPEPSPAPKQIEAVTMAKNPPTLSQTLIASTKSLYANLVDGLITTFLLISIVFTAVTIIL